MKSLTFCSLFCVLLCTTLGRAEPLEAVAPVYIPADESLWADAMKLRTAKDWNGMLALCRKSYSTATKTTQGAEVRLLCIQALLGAGFPIAASEMGLELMERHPGSQPTLHALIILEKSFHQSNVDMERWQAAVQFLSVPNATSEVRSMINYFRTIRLTTLKYDRWAANTSVAVEPNTYWAARLKFYDGIDDVRADHIDPAIEKFQDVLKNSTLPTWFRNTVSLQLARLYFEKKDYDKVDDLYQGYSSDSRDYGRALLDRAWINYHRKLYSHSLGLLTVLKSSFFATVKDPERYLLTVLIYKHLCHFDEIK